MGKLIGQRKKTSKLLTIKCTCCRKRPPSPYNPFYCNECMAEAQWLRSQGCLYPVMKSLEELAEKIVKLRKRGK